MTRKLIIVKKSGPSSSPSTFSHGNDSSVSQQPKCGAFPTVTRDKTKMTASSSSSYPFKCPSCDFTAPTQIRIDYHRVTHSTERPWRCPEVNCDFRTKLEPRLNRHIKCLHRNQPKSFKCEPCGYSGKTLRQLKTHFESIRHVQTKLLISLESNKSTNNPPGQSIQSLENGDEPPPSASPAEVKRTLGCPLCPKKFAFPIHLQIHLKRHQLGRPYKCSMCDFAGGERKTLEIHIRGKHTGEKPYKCGFTPCQFTSASHSARKDHEDRVHRRLRKFNCSEQGCHYRAFKPLEFQVHMRRHKGKHPFACPKVDCPFTSVTRCGVQNHMQTRHSASRPFKCPWCPFSSKTKGFLPIHLRRHTGEKPYKCTHENCTFAAAHVSTLTGHRLRIHQRELYIKKFQCPHCPVKHETNSGLIHHIKTHTGEKPFRCSLEGCKYRSLTKSNLRSHLTRFHGDERPFPCHLCQYRAKCSKGLKSHVATHTQEKGLKCPHCEYKCIQHHSMKSHIRTHTGERPFACTLCQYRATTAGSLNVHLKVHTGEKPIKCHLCDYTAAVPNRLQAHLRTHSDERPFRCQEEGCNFAARQPSNLRTHWKRVHNGERVEKKYTCPFCQFKVMSRQELECHIRVHTGEKPFACQLCEYRTTQKSHLTTHQKSHERHKNFGIFHCPHCPYVSRTGVAKNFQKHMKTHRLKPFQCPQCPSGGSVSKKGLRVHVRKMHENDNNYYYWGHNKEGGRGGQNLEKFTCKFCKLTTKSEVQLILHTNERHRWPVVLIQRL